MPISARRVTEQVIARIRSSEYRMTIYYPAITPKPTGAAPIWLPTSPLMPTPNPKPETGDAPERAQSDVTVQCLYMETSQLSDMRQQRMRAEVGGWSHDIVALARVVGSDVERAGGAGTLFDGCAFVEILGRRYKVRSVVRQAASTTLLGTYYILLAGATKE